LTLDKKGDYCGKSNEVLFIRYIICINEHTFRVHNSKHVLL